MQDVEKIEKIVSGGQSGADLAGNEFAKKHGIKTEINTFKGFKPLYDELPLDIKINYIETCNSKSYPANLRCRTKYNVVNSNFTIILLRKPLSFTIGSKLTYNECIKFRKDVLFIDISTHEGGLHNSSTEKSWYKPVNSLNEAKTFVNSVLEQPVITSFFPGFVLNIAGERDLNKQIAVEFLEKLLITTEVKA